MNVVSPELSQVRAVVFDLDDTLYPEITYVQSGFRAAANLLADKAHPAEPIFERLWGIFQQGRRDRVFDTVLAELGRPIDAQAVGTLVKAYREHRPTIALEPDVKETLIALQKEYRLGLISDGFLPAQRLKAEALGLNGLLNAMIFTEELGRQYWKPHKRAFEEMSELLSCPPSQCLYVADNPAKDFLAPNRLGWITVQAKRPDAVHEANPVGKEYQPRYLLNSVTQLQELLDTGR